MRIEALGERGLLLRDFAGPPAWKAARRLRSVSLPGLVDAVASYETVGLHFESGPCQVEAIENALAGIDPESNEAGRIHTIPVCYEFGPDLERAAGALHLGKEELIEAHLLQTFTCHAVGFCPGFAYLGYLPEAMAGLPRLPSPRARVEPGSVGITGRQTAVYPLPTPGGWWLIGRTPLKLVSLSDGYFPIEAGDAVRFERIDAGAFAKLAGERL